ncbi:hypothetical protein H6P81_004057 [Aristolochia fimbriata]|uniref:J domain-containing protein n=1 Tax=Aristolochia fimbriata TaxID=158543 RepID=A0AAV7FGB1_ARIFI|nr:hypothetical protein H6P81_004057 [Aristolochia fimbriata]
MEKADSRSRLVAEICSVPSKFASCDHLRRFQQPFVDWYLVLRVDEKAELNTIRKRYLHLALQLHPDKNRHPKAGIAFKLLSEAYEVLSNESKRKAFNAEKRNRECKECIKKPSCTAKWTSSENIKPPSCIKQTRASNTVAEARREARQRFMDEAQVIRNCLRVRSSLGKENPIFDPSDPRLFPGYPHFRNQIKERTTDLWYSNRGCHQRFSATREKCKSPLYEIRSEPVVRSKAAFIRP